MECELNDNTLIVDEKSLFKYEIVDDWNCNSTDEAIFYNIEFLSSCFIKYNNSKYENKEIYVSFNKETGDVEIYVAKPNSINEELKELFKYPFYNSNGRIKTIKGSSIKKLNLEDYVKTTKDNGDECTGYIGTILYKTKNIQVVGDGGSFYVWHNPNNIELIKKESNIYKIGELKIDDLNINDIFGYKDKEIQMGVCILKIENNHIWILNQDDYCEKQNRYFINKCVSRNDKDLLSKEYNENFKIITINQALKRMWKAY